MTRDVLTEKSKSLRTEKSEKENEGRPGCDLGLLASADPSQLNGEVASVQKSPDLAFGSRSGQHGPFCPAFDATYSVLRRRTTCLSTLKGPQRSEDGWLLSECRRLSVKLWCVRRSASILTASAGIRGRDAPFLGVRLMPDTITVFSTMRPSSSPVIEIIGNLMQNMILVRGNAAQIARGPI
ncbi:hypothetical protein BDZ89DRAFT_1045817 [Hymenopellis radicata]|nr:hypothetical protein BDZ89DRAFT_1045817 [Hymenopellis radicata]